MLIFVEENFLIGANNSSNTNSDMKYFLLFLLFCLFIHSSGHAQSYEEYRQKMESRYEKYRQKKEADYQNYREKVNAEFAKFMRREWTEFQSREALPVPHRPEPPQPMVKLPDALPSNETIPHEEIQLKPHKLPLPRPSIPWENQTPSTSNKKHLAQGQTLSFDFYGTPCQAIIPTSASFKLEGVDENSVADAWQMLTDEKYLPVIESCLKLRSELKLCDWGYVRLVEKFTQQYFHPKGQTNEARLLQMFILTQSGYKVRIARSGQQLILLLPSIEEIYEYAYLTIHGTKYYIIHKGEGNGRYMVFDREFPKEQFFSLEIHDQPKLAYRPSTSKIFKARNYLLAETKIEVNQNLIDFYNDYPLNSQWEVYVRASMSKNLKRQLYPALRTAIHQKGMPSAVNLLLNFVQTAFKYRTDDKQFGEERALFADETFFYPYSDCEDRAILFAQLVHDLLHLDVVLLNYPGHLATAVHFEESLTGDHLMLNGKKYLVCDPTYIGARLGDAMPQNKRQKAKVIRIY